MEKNKSIKKGLIIGLTVCTLNIVGFLSSYAYFISNIGNNKNQKVTIETGTFELTFSDGNNGINAKLNFGESITKTFTIENTGSLDVSAILYFDNLINTYNIGSLTYQLAYSENENGEYNEIIANNNIPTSNRSASRILADLGLISPKKKLFYKLTITLNYLSHIDQTADLNAKFITNFSLKRPDEMALNTLNSLGLKTKPGNPIFANSATTDETKDGLYSLDDNYGTSYYFRGAVENNYVKFAGFYWRIIRINGDGSLKILYDGTYAHTNDDPSADRVAMENQPFHTRYGDAKYVGYMFGGENGVASTKRTNFGEIGYEDSKNAIYNETNSDIKIALENWYLENLSKYDDQISDIIYCNDRTIADKKISGLSGDTGLGYGANKTSYGITIRMNLWNPTLLTKPEFKCLNKNDAFTKSDIQNGNGKLNHKIGLITGDEALAGGTGKYSGQITNEYLYLFKNNWYWTMSPTSFNASSTRILRVVKGYLYANLATSNQNGSLIPVISLTPEYVNTFIGDGSLSNPYRSKEPEI